MKSYEAFKALGKAIQADLETATPTQIADLIHELKYWDCLLYTSPSPRDGLLSRMPSSA